MVLAALEWSLETSEQVRSALKESFHAAHGLGNSARKRIRILSIIFWCLMLIISIKYVAIVMRASINNGEGGIMALLALNLRKAKIADNKKIYMIAIGFIGHHCSLVTVLLPQPFRYCLQSKGCLLQPMCLTVHYAYCNYLDYRHVAFGCKSTVRRL